ncbi:U-box domain-containing protein 35-like isoform X2 [Magnolia sinica]|uniref:U-box domain-containing protein 35-like isoform X2 n=1 Tax=Magnolia sinica TaxID=86752 RepID=UPI00265AAC90|nr:U-box domain-containing protein 35-like isoform X2 [Magnolia sinica]
MRSGVIRNRKGGKGSEPQVVVVAVDADKNSQHALKWAADNVISKGQVFFLLHIRKKIITIPTPTGQQLPISDVDEELASTFLQQIDLQTKELLLPFQCFCSRRALQCKEVILDDDDISKAIINYVVHQSADKLILGTSSRSAFTRAFKQADVPTSVLKMVPEFCSLYVISKGRITLTRQAPKPNTYPRRSSPKFEAAGNAFQSTKSEPVPTHHDQEFVRSPPERNSRILCGPERGISAGSNENQINERINSVSQGGGHLDFSYQSMSSCPSPLRNSIEQPNIYVLRDQIDGMARQSRFFGTRDGYYHHDEKMRVFEPSRSGKQYWSNQSGFSEYGHSLLGLQEPGGASWSSHSQAQDLQPSKVEKERGREPKRFSRAAATGMTEEKERSRAALGASQAALNMAELDETKRQNKERRFLVEGEEERKILQSLSKDVRYRRYTIKEIEIATSNFSEKLKIGEGGYGPVFKANLDSTLVAIKILRADTSQGMKQFQQEIEVLSCIRHPNMVLLMGACPDCGCLVYEYMANGSLEDRLFCRDNTPPLSWQLRFKIASEIATGLLFLHQTKPEPLVHRDLKPGNILLDHNFVSKIADVGLARLVPPSVTDSVTQYRMTAAAGTFCYIDPEYQQTGLLGIKSDIYALGIILLQLVTALPPMGLAHNVERAINAGRFKRILDVAVPDWPMEDALKFAKLALKCAELRRKDRPDLQTVVLPELIRLKELADQLQPSPRFSSRHCYANSYQEVISVPSIKDSSFLDDNRIVKGYTRSKIMGGLNK